MILKAKVFKVYTWLHSFMKTENTMRCKLYSFFGFVFPIYIFVRRLLQGFASFFVSMPLRKTRNRSMRRKDIYWEHKSEKKNKKTEV